MHKYAISNYGAIGEYMSLMSPVGLQVNVYISVLSTVVWRWLVDSFCTFEHILTPFSWNVYWIKIDPWHQVLWPNLQMADLNNGNNGDFENKMWEYDLIDDIAAILKDRHFRCERI